MRDRREGDVLGDSSIEYIITVPAIWLDRAKQITRNCAIEAFQEPGRPPREVHIIQEPEAAATYAVDTNKEYFDVGDTFVLCDAGGG
jgi:molecular chaperone DnaK (HSP70)